MHEGYQAVNVVFRATIIPGLVVLIWLLGLISFGTVQACLIIFLLIFVVCPLIFRYSVTLQRGILFLTFITYPRNLDLSKPSSVGLYGTRSFFVKVLDPNAETENENNELEIKEHSSSQDRLNSKKNYVRVGVWHILPKYMVNPFSKELDLDESDYRDLENVTSSNQQEKTLNEIVPLLKSSFPVIDKNNEQHFYERLLKIPGNPIVLYLHGNTASRGSGHRIDVYRLLRQLGYHVISLDYRGYGDSDPVSPTEEGVVLDAIGVFHYIRNLTTNPIFIWGHSLGTGVATNMLSQLKQNPEMKPRGVILEAPFTNIRDEIRQHPFARFFKHLPWFNYTIAEPMYENSLRFESDQHINEFHQPVMILHAEDDYVIPFQLGYRLYRIALDKRHKSWGPVEFHRFDGSRQFGHKFICYAPELPELIKDFVERYKEVYF